MHSLSEGNKMSFTNASDFLLVSLPTEPQSEVAEN